MLTVRRACERDGPDLAKIRLATWTPTVLPAPPPDDPSSHAFFTNATSPDAVVVAEVDGVIVGWAKVRRSRPCPPMHTSSRSAASLSLRLTKVAGWVDSSLRQQRRSAPDEARANSLCACSGPILPLAGSTKSAASSSRVCSGRSSCWTVVTSTMCSWAADSCLRTRTTTAGCGRPTRCRGARSAVVLRSGVDATAVDVEGDAGDPGRVGGEQEDGGGGDVVGVAEATERETGGQLVEL